MDRGFRCDESDHHKMLCIHLGIADLELPARIMIMILPDILPTCKMYLEVLGEKRTSTPLTAALVVIFEVKIMFRS